MKRRMLVALVAAVAVGLAACGSSNDEQSAQKDSSAPAREGEAGRRSDGALRRGRRQHRSRASPTTSTASTSPTRRSGRCTPSNPTTRKTPEPDLAEAAPEISADGKTVTVKIRSGVKFSPPVNRVVTSKDVAYGIERGFLKTVNGPYVGAYMGDLLGLKAFQDGKAKQHRRDPDAGRHHDRLQARPPARSDLRRRACPAGLRARAARVRGEVRRQEPTLTAPTRWPRART